MKKFFSFACALFACVVAFATVEVPTTVPDDATLNGYKAEGANVVVAFYTTAPICNDIVFIGSYNGWNSSDPTQLIKFEAVENFSGWYVVSFNDSTASIEGKPVQLKSDGTFSWDYQLGDDAVAVRGTLTIEPGYAGEVNLKGYGTDAPVVFAFGKWKNDNNPCVAAERHNYTVILDAPYCADENGEYFDPAIVGDFNGWNGAEAPAMNLILEGENAGKYTYSFEDEVGHAFKFKASTDTDWTNEIQLLDSTGNWVNANNIVLGADTVIVVDYSAGKYTKCVEEQTAVENVEAKDVRKVIENGRLVIYVGEERYNALGIKE